MRLFFGYVAVVAAALAGGYDYKVGFENAKLYTLIGVVVYFASYGAMNVWQYAVEKNLVFEGVNGDGLKVYTSTHPQETGIPIG